MRATPIPIPAPASAPEPPRRVGRAVPPVELVRLLEFVWATRAGDQPVLYLVRTYLH
jgi:hypothetical protein